MSERNFFAELKRRNVYKVAIAYAVVAWLIIQAASILLPTFEAPAWVMKVAVMAVLLGFPAALIFSWAFEITPEGIKLESEIEPNKSIARRTGRKLIALTIAVAVIAAGLFVFQVIRARSTSSTAATTISNKSIAVLPFDNLSRDPDNAYFCEGVQDEILTRLAKVADLKVISRTSTQHFKSTPDNLPQIANQLGVAHILEGSVQKASDQVRVNVQLINAQSDAHLWADTYDRKLTDIFAVESEIAKTIAETLQAKITGSEKNSIAKTPTVNPEAYELYLKGRFFWNKRSGVDLRKAIEFFNQAIAKDPNYALAYAGLADSYLLLPNYGGAATSDVIPPARAAVTNALELDDSLAEAHASLGLLDTLDLHLERAITHMERAVQLKPNYATGHHWLGLGHLALGHFDPAIAEGKRAAELDPLSVIINADLAWTYATAHRLDEAEAQARKTLEIDPRFFLAHYYLGGVRQAKGQLPEAISEFQQAFDLNGDFYSLAMLGQAYARAGNKAEAQRILARLNEAAKSRHVSPYAWALLYLGLGDKDRALSELETAKQRGDTNYLFMLKVDTSFDDLRGNPRFEALVQKIAGEKK
ncbi:MAG: hypothetical protein QOI04_1668 [Verrucomicrobiota bacterium]|jgi:TolB-like protein/Tfp pilus assembly protein PilF